MTHREYNISISANYFFPFISFVEFIVVTHKFGGKCYFIFLLIIMYWKNWYVKISTRNYNLNFNTTGMLSSRMRTDCCSGRH